MVLLRLAPLMGLLVSNAGSTRKRRLKSQSRKLEADRAVAPRANDLLPLNNAA